MTTTLGMVVTTATGAESTVSALIDGLLRSPDTELVLLIHYVGIDSGAERPVGLTGRRGVIAVEVLADLTARSDIILMYGGPEDALVLLKALRIDGSPNKTVICSASGVSLDRIRGALGPGPSVFRAVLNLGAGAGEGVLVLCPELGTPDVVVERTAQLFASLGVVEILPEDSLEAAKAVAASSIGFLAVALEGFEDGAVQVGLPRAIARPFVRQTALGAALLLRSHQGSPADLKDQVASPGGTTIAGLAVLEDLGVRGAFIRAIEAAAEQGRHNRDEDWPPVVE